MESKPIVLSLMAHPDDAEILAGGTLSLLASKGWKVVIASMTPGQAGSTHLNAEEISAVRRVEAKKAAEVIGGDYYCMEAEDVFIAYEKPLLLKVIELFRTVQPQMVITNSPQDYMLDHEITSHLAQTACMGASIPNILIPESETSPDVPHLYYADAVQGKDRFGTRVIADLYVDITTKMSVKEEMLKCHASQRDWLQSISKVDDYILMMKEFSRENGGVIGKEYAEGFRQHLGYSYPQDDLLGEVLRAYVYNIETNAG